MSELYTKYATEQYVDDNLNIGLETKADAEHNHDSSYDVKGAANTALNSAKEYVDEAVSSLDTIIAIDPNSDGNIVLRPYIPEEDFIQVDKTLTIEGAAADAKAVGDRIKNLTTSGDAPVLDAVLGADGIMTYNNSPAFDEWLTEAEASEKYAHRGYGLGLRGIDLSVLTDFNDAIYNGWYAFNANTLNHPSTTGSGVVRVDSYRDGSSSMIIQTAYVYGMSSYYVGHLVRVSHNGVWGAWEWENPPMILDYEFRTTERWNGYPVFTIILSCGNATNKMVVNYPSDIASNINRLIRYAGRIGGQVVPNINGNDLSNAFTTHMSVSTTSAVIYVGSSMSGSGTYLQLWYTRGDA